MKLLTVLVLSLAVSTVYGNTILPPDSTLTLFQKTEIKILVSDGRKYYNEDNYRAALVKFREALAISEYSAEANYWVAECHLGMKNHDVALKYAQKALNLGGATIKELYYVLGQSYHNLGYLPEALDAYRKAQQVLSKSRAEDFRIATEIAACEYAIEAKKQPLDVKIKALTTAINSKHDDYAPMLSKDGKSLYFSSRQAQNTGGGFSSGDNKYFSDIFIADWDDKLSTWKKASNTDKRIKNLNTGGFDDIAFLSSNGNMLYLCVNTEGILNTNVKTQSTDIFKSYLSEENTWTIPIPIDKTINSIGFEASPTFTSDGRTMYFVSERLSGEGKADIWTSTKIDGRWTKPENLGNVINTKHQETTVFVSGDGQYLFFSSDGHRGFGGYDVFVTKRVNGSWATPVNLGFPINDVSDETHFIYYPELNKGFYSKLSTPANGGIGYRDIFEIDLSNFELDKLF